MRVLLIKLVVLLQKYLDNHPWLRMQRYDITKAKCPHLPAFGRFCPLLRDNHALTKQKTTQNTIKLPQKTDEGNLRRQTLVYRY